jgi:deazaflavin-dependent oxidoreductase (nitroreductase family)
MTQQQITVPTGTPSAFSNSMVALMLKTPGLQRFLGRALMLLTFTGRRSGERYTIPVSYARVGDRVLAVTKVFRHWWKNFETNPEVELRLAGKVYAGRASAAVGDESRFEQLRDYLATRPMDAKAYGVRMENRSPVAEDVRALLPQVVMVDITLDREPVRA